MAENKIHVLRYFMINSKLLNTSDCHERLLRAGDVTEGSLKEEFLETEAEEL